MNQAAVSPAVIRRRIRVRGIVQGVGYRPFVWRVARELGVAGGVRNDAEGVEIEAIGSAAAIDEMVRRLHREAPPLARVDTVEVSAALAGDETVGDFAILASGAGVARTAIGADSAVCPACLAEVFDPEDRRYRYAFTTCTHCGPRYTIARALPYDRERTSLAPFPLCPACAAEYRDPADRRFHAEATCCPVCGPQLALHDAAGTRLVDDDPLRAAVARLKAGEIVAIKSLGGFHLACDARNADAVARLRERKQREEKPFAVMVANADSLAGLAEVDAASRALLESLERPIVLLRKGGRESVGMAACGENESSGVAPGQDVLPGVAPGVAWLGALLPVAPLHYLLFHEAAGRPAASAWLGDAQPLALVMTSANPHGEPLVTDNTEAFERLAGIADAYLLHDRAIVARCDDSVLRPLPAPGGGAQFVRRARGYTPTAIRLPQAGPSVLAFGGAFKNTICVTRGNEAFLSTHIGGLDNAATCAFFDETIARMLALLEVEPRSVAHDRHPDFHATRTAVDFAAQRGLPAVAVQHHHAHIAAVCAEHGVGEPVLGLALDGVGLGDDGGAWGGELLRVDGGGLRRLGHLRPLALPGGDRAAREPWRMAAAALRACGRGDEIVARFGDQPGAATLAQMLERNLNCPPTSSLGRYFDAAAGLLGVRAVMSYEGQAAMLLEGLADRFGPVEPLADGWRIADGVLDLTPLLAFLADSRDAGRAAATFHATVARALAEWAVAAARQHGLSIVAGGGGCFLNRVLSAALRRELTAAGVDFLEARRAPPNDGGLALGQAWVAMNGIG